MYNTGGGNKTLEVKPIYHGAPTCLTIELGNVLGAVSLANDSTFEIEMECDGVKATAKTDWGIRLIEWGSVVDSVFITTRLIKIFLTPGGMAF